VSLKEIAIAALLNTKSLMRVSKRQIFKINPELQLRNSELILISLATVSVVNTCAYGSPTNARVEVIG
jgi:hypothetical protein